MGHSHVLGLTRMKILRSPCSHVPSVATPNSLLVGLENYMRCWDQTFLSLLSSICLHLSPVLTPPVPTGDDCAGLQQLLRLLL